MKPIPPITAEEFFQEAEAFAKTEAGADLIGRRSPTSSDVGFKIWKWHGEGGGYCGAVMAQIVHGDTVGETIRAALDCLMRVPSRRERLNEPYFTSEREAKQWDKARRYSYDYRAIDWKPPE